MKPNDDITPELPSVEGLDDNAAGEALIASLSDIEDKDGETIFGAPFRTVNELIDHIRRKTPEGLRMIEAHRQLEAVVSDKEQKPSEETRRSIARLIFGGFIKGGVR